MNFPLYDMFFASIARKSAHKLKRLTQHLGVFEQIRRERRDLSQLDDSLLRDIGLTRNAAGREANRSYWDVPAHRVLADEKSTSGSPMPRPFVIMRPLS